MKLCEFAKNLNVTLFFVNPLIGLLILIAVTYGWLFLARLLFLIFLFLTFTSFVLGLAYLQGKRSRAGAWLGGAAFFYSLFIFFAYGQHILAYNGFFHFMMVTVHPYILICWAFTGWGCGIRAGVLLNAFSIFIIPIKKND